ncbi:MAG: phosphatidylglycerol lysyltransferase, partial [Treponema sp.]|nr:phosphatidylglycerol lysyltransferase [Treponema sp.]
MINGIDTALLGMILSASGWRGVFAQDGDEESFCPDISPSSALLAAAAATAFSSYLRDIKREGSVIIGRDTRPTGKAICDAMIRVLANKGQEIIFTDIIAAPELMAYARSEKSAAGFIYVSASHNPVGHNGLKFGLTDGGVLGGREAAILIEKFKALLASKDANLINSIEHETKFHAVSRMSECLAEAPDKAAQSKITEIYAESASRKTDAEKAYTDFTKEVISGLPNGKNDEIFALLEKGLEHPLGIVADYNGSARTVSIDREFLSALGIKVKSINDQPGQIAHTIVPEGKSLDPCRELLEICHKEDPAFVMGYVPDCDGDRGNLVIWDNSQNRARVLEAQEVFALSCVAELSYLVWAKTAIAKTAIAETALAVNDPTSLRIDRIAQAFNIPVFRAEVGEANVVSLARKLRNDGYQVRILGEGSNGGNITHPAAVRDPLNTLGALIKLFCLRSEKDRKGLYEIWCGLSGQSQTYRKDFSLTDVIASLPTYTSTAISSEEAVLKVKTLDHGLLKNRYQKVFLQNWEERKEELKAKYGVYCWDVCAYNGIEETPRIAQFGEAGKGGLKIGFLNKEGQKIACIWMRGSGTEPVFRIMADAEGSDPSFERYLIAWQREMV